MSRRKLERSLKAGKEVTKETVCNFDKLEWKGNFTFDKGTSGVYALQFSLDQEYLAVGYADGCVQALTYSGDKPKLYKELRGKKYSGLPVTCLRFSPKQHQVVYASSSDGFVYACNLQESSVRVVAEEEKNEINGLDFNNRGDTFVTGGRDLCVRLYDVDTDKLVRHWEGYNVQSEATETPSQRIFCVKYDPQDRDVFLTGGWDNHVKVWDSRLEHPVLKMFSGPHICGDSIDFAGHKVVTGSWTQHDALQIWDLRYNKVLQTLPFHVTDGAKPLDDTGAYIYCAQFADRHTVLAGGSGTHSIQAISVPDNKVIGELKLHGVKPQMTDREASRHGGKVGDNIVQALDSTDGGRHLAFGGLCDQLVIASLEGGSPRDLTQEELHPRD